MSDMIQKLSALVLAWRDRAHNYKKPIARPALHNDAVLRASLDGCSEATKDCANELNALLMTGLQARTPSIEEAAKYFLEAAQGKLPCGHTIADLIWAPGSITKCGACLMDRMESRKAAGNQTSPCPTCSGLGIVPRNVPGPEQPKGEQ